MKFCLDILVFYVCFLDLIYGAHNSSLPLINGYLHIFVEKKVIRNKIKMFRI